jgi:hypothetical protein
LHPENAPASAEAGVTAPVRVSPDEAPGESLLNRSPAVDPVIRGSLQRVIEALSMTMGPIAVTIVQEHIAALGESRYAFPEKRLGELLKSLEAAITEEELRAFTTHFHNGGRVDA